MKAGNNSNADGIRRSITGPELNRLCGISRQWRAELVKRGILPRPYFITGVSRPRWWADEVDAALAKVRPEAEQVVRERAERMRALRAMRKGANQ